MHLQMQMMVATFNNYQELVDKAIILEGKQQQIDNRKRKDGQGKYNSGAQQKPRFTPNSGGHTHHNHGSHITMEGVHITTVALRMEMGMEGTTTRAVPTQKHPLRRT